MTRKVAELGGSVVGIEYAPDDEKVIEEKLRDLVHKGADLLITTGGMSVDLMMSPALLSASWALRA